jgi:hypothetical protein
MLLHVVITESVFVSVDDAVKARKISAKWGPIVFYCGSFRAVHTLCPFQNITSACFSFAYFLIVKDVGECDNYVHEYRSGIGRGYRYEEKLINSCA